MELLKRDTWTRVFGNFDAKDPKQICGLFGASKWLRLVVARYFGPLLRTTYVLHQQMLPHLYPDMCKNNIYVHHLSRWTRPHFEAAYPLLHDAEIVSLWIFYTMCDRKLKDRWGFERDEKFLLQCKLDSQEISLFRQLFNKHWQQARCTVVLQTHPKHVGELDARIATIQQSRLRLLKELQHAQAALMKYK